MATCQSCGAELTGAYCNTCGARAPEARAARKPKGGQARGLAPQRITRFTAMGLLGIALFGAGMLTGFWMAGPGTGPLTSPVADSTASLLPIAAASKYMDEGIDLLNKGERTAATASFRKAIAQYEQVLKAEPDNLYARSYMGLTYYYMGDSKKALEAERAVLDKDPNYLWAVFNLAWIYETGGKPDQALLMYQKYVAVAPAEKENQAKYAEQFELIDRQVEASRTAVEKLKGGAGK